MNFRILLVLILVFFAIFISFFLLKGNFLTEKFQKNKDIVKIDLSMLLYVPTRRYFIPENELPQKLLDALSGDIKASLTVSCHYVHREIIGNEIIHWFIIGAENGEPEIQYALADRLLNFSNNDLDSKIRGIFWLYKTIKKGYKKKESKAMMNKFGCNFAIARPPADKRFSHDYKQFTEDEIANCRIGALQGNGKAALLLGSYYSEIALDKDISEYWYRIGAQNGSSECQYRLGQILIGRDNEHDQIRGRFWLEQATRNGYKRNAKY